MQFYGKISNLCEDLMKIKLINLILFFGLIWVAAPAFADNKSPYFLESQQPYFVGEIGAAWQFPSDHLPRGASVGNFHIAFWNILNKDYLYHIEENTQGLRDSSIITDNVPADPNDTLTVREMFIGQLIIDMINHPTHPRSLIGLEETHKDVHKYLQQHLPSPWKIATPPNQPFSQDIFLYDSEKFELIDLEAIQYTEKFPKTIFTITLLEKQSNQVFRFLQSHIPGGPVDSAAGCAKFAEEALRQYDPNLTMVLMGDMNQTPDVIQEALEKAAADAGISQPFDYLPIAYPSHINTKLKASWIDNFFIYSPDTSIVGSDQPEELFEDLRPLVQLLNDFNRQ